MKLHQPKVEQPSLIAASIWLVLRAWIELLRVDMQLARRGFPFVYEKVRSSRVRKHRLNGRKEADICRAVDLACVFYFKQVRCLQCSAAATTLLRNEGHAAEMVIGAQPCPFRAHAWVEVAGRAVNDKSYISTMYNVLERC
jgi:hypothetical protein